jgi:type IV pilus assembly protein PilC
MRTPTLRDHARSIFLASLASALRAGQEPRVALDLLGEDDLDGRLARVAQALARHSADKPLSEAMALMPGTFSPATVEIVREGERSRKLAEALDLVAADSARSAELGYRVALALTFPAIGLCAAFIVLLICMVLVIPAYKQVFASFGADLPWLTLALIEVSDLMSDFWYLFIGIPIAAVVAYLWRSKYAYGRRLDRLLLRLPFFGNHLVRLYNARMAGLLADAVRLGIDARAALAYLRDTSGNRALAERADALASEAAAGAGIASWLAKSRSVPKRLSTAAAVQADAPRLAAALADAAGQYAEVARAGAARLERGTFIWAYLIVGLIVGATVIAMYMPIFMLGAAV